MRKFAKSGVFAALLLLISAGGAQTEMSEGRLQTATLAGGCFWCMEAVFQRIDGVEKVVSGYSGGTAPNPVYDDVKDGETGHAEAIEVTFDPAKVTFKEILEIFFHLHDPTTLNRQGNDIGSQYRSAIFYHGAEQQRQALEVKAQIEKAGLWSEPIVTEITPYSKFFPAEEYHQNYYNRNPRQGYCSIVIAPKIQKLLFEFKDRLKPEALRPPAP